MRPKFDEKDATILAERETARKAIDSPAVGDYVITAEGESKRIAYIWPANAERGTRYQLTKGGRFYFDQSGEMSYSGGLEPSQELDLQPHEYEFGKAKAWFFHHDWATGHNGVDIRTPVRQWTIRPKFSLSHVRQAYQGTLDAAFRYEWQTKGCRAVRQNADAVEEVSRQFSKAQAYRYGWRHV